MNTSDAGNAKVAVLQFLANWQTVQVGEIRKGETLAIEYARERLPYHCHWFRGALFGDIEAHVRFLPGGQSFVGSVVEKVRALPETQGGGPVIDLKPTRLEVSIPEDADRIEIWFRGIYQTTGLYETWDSQYGQNYCFPIGNFFPTNSSPTSPSH